MARVPQYPLEEQKPQQRRDSKPVIKPEGKFIRERKIHVTTQRSPKSVTRINPEEMTPILPEMPYIPPQ
jgi:hypothetical protein